MGTYRGVDLDQLLDMNNEQLMELFTCRIRRKFSRGMKRKPMALIKKLRKKKEGRSRQREARHCEDSPEEHGGGPRDDRLHCWCLQRESLHSGGDQARDDWTLPGRVLHLLQACQARQTWYRSHPLLKIHPSEVNAGVLLV